MALLVHGKPPVSSTNCGRSRRVGGPGPVVLDQLASRGLLEGLARFDDAAPETQVASIPTLLLANNKVDRTGADVPASRADP